MDDFALQMALVDGLRSPDNGRDEVPSNDSILKSLSNPISASPQTASSTPAPAGIAQTGTTNTSTDPRAPDPPPSVSASPANPSLNAFFAGNNDYFGLPPGTLNYWKMYGHSRSVNPETNYFYNGLSPEDQFQYLYGGGRSGRLRDIFDAWTPPVADLPKPQWATAGAMDERG